MKFASLILLSAAVAIQGRTVGSNGALMDDGAFTVQGIAWDTIEDFPATEFPFAGQDDGDEDVDDYS